MKTNNHRRLRLRTSPVPEGGGSRKEAREETRFFGPAAGGTFFQPSAPLLRAEEPKQEEEKVHRAAEEEKLHRVKEEEKLERAPEDEKIAKAPEEKEQEKKVTRKAEGGAPAGGKASRYLQSIDSKGQPLPARDRDFFGRRMGYDFSHVRIHAGGEAAETARDVRARAFTYGSHIVFAESQYDTGTHRGKHLLAHELAHVAQRSPAGHLRRRTFLETMGAVRDIAVETAGAVGAGLILRPGITLQMLQTAGAWMQEVRDMRAALVWNHLLQARSRIIDVIDWIWNGILGARGHVRQGMEAMFHWLEQGREGLFTWIWQAMLRGAPWAMSLLQGNFDAFWLGLGEWLSWLRAGLGAFLVEWGWRGLEALLVWAQSGIHGLAQWIWNGVSTGAAWVGRFLARIADLLGAGELWTALSSDLKWFSTRQMNGMEVAEASRVFAGSLDYARVRIDEGSAIASIGAVLRDAPGMGVTLAHTINFNRPIGAGDMAWLVHELTHVGQYTYAGLRYIGEALHAQATVGYGYGGGAALAGRDLADFNREQQGNILRDYYERVVHGSTPFAADYLRLRNQAVAGNY